MAKVRQISCGCSPDNATSAQRAANQQFAHLERDVQELARAVIALESRLNPSGPEPPDDS